MKHAKYGYIGVALLFLVSLVFLYAAKLPRVDAYHMDMNAAAVLGQANFTDTFVNENHPEKGLSRPNVRSDGTRLFVADCDANRVLIYNTIPAGTGALPDVVVGQTNFTNTSANQGGSTSASTLSCPTQAINADGKLIVADSSNNRVLIWNSIPTSNNTAADIVIGQTDMTTNTGGTSATKMRYLNDVSYDSASGKLAITSNNDHRVLLYNSVPTSNGAAADVVIGQATFTGNSSNQGGSVAANTLRSPAATRFIGTKLAIADSFNSRVLIYDTVPVANNASANVVIGQANLTSATFNSGGLSASSLTYPYDIAYDGTRLAVVDGANHRVLVFNTVPIANKPSADAVLGQPDFTTNSPGTSSQKLTNPLRVEFIGGSLFVSENTNHRIMGFTSQATNTAAAVLVGQAAFSDSLAYAGVTLPSHLSNPQGVFSDGTRLFVADSGKNRVLIWNSIPTTNNASPDVVVGQPDFLGYSPNQGGNVAANTLQSPQGVFSDGTRLFVADSGNSRALIWNTIPTSNNQPADVVIGQPDMVTDTYNTTQTQFGWVTGISYDPASGKLVITDADTRVLIYNSVPTTNGAPADVVVGQSDFTSNVWCTFGAATASCLGGNYGTAQIINGKLVVPDNVDNRVLIWNSVPTANGAPADVVVGQPDFTSTEFGGPGDTVLGSSLARPNGVAYDGKRFFINDSNTCRILVYDHIPTTNGESANYALGINNLTSYGYGCFPANSVGQNNFSSTRFGNPLSTASDRLFLADSDRNRVLIFNNPTPTVLNLQVPAVTSDSTPAISWSFSDGDPGDIQVKYRIQIDTSSSFNSSNLRDTGWIGSAANQYAVPSSLADGQWYVRLQLADSQNDEGEWSSIKAMTVNTKPATPQQTPEGEETTNGNGSTNSPAAPADQPPVGSMATLRRIMVNGRMIATEDASKETVYSATNRPTIEGTTEPFSTVLITIENIGEFSVTADTSGQWTFTPDSDIADGTYPTTIVAIDQAGNKSAPVGFVLGVSTPTADMAATGAVTTESGINWPAVIGVVLLLPGIAWALWLLYRRRFKKHEGPVITGQN